MNQKRLRVGLGRGAWAGAIAAGLMLAGPVAVRAESAQLHNTTGLTYFYQNKDKQAYAEFVRALETDPSFAEPRFNLGRLFERQSRVEDALQQYKAALQIDPGMERARRKVQDLEGKLAEVGKPSRPALPAPGLVSSEARGSEKEAIRKLIEAGELAEAGARLSQLKLTGPVDTDILLMEADLAEKSGDVAGALMTLKTLRPRVEGNADVPYRLANAHFRLGQFGPALEEVEEAIRLRPTFADAFHLMGLINLNTERLSEAYNAFQEASRLDPGLAAARGEQERLARKLGLFYYNSGLLFFQQRNWLKAQEFLKKSIDQGNLNPEQSAIAQQYLVIAEFSLAKVADQIRDIQNERRFVYAGQVSKQVLQEEAQDQPVSFGADHYADFTGYVVHVDNRKDTAELLVTRLFPEQEARVRLQRDGFRAEGGYRANTEMEGWFKIETPTRLPDDPRVREGSKVQVMGRLKEPEILRNPWNFTYSRRRQPVVLAARIEFQRERRDTFLENARREEIDLENGFFDQQVQRRAGRAQPRPPVNTNPGLSGPLRIDFLKYSEEQKKNLAVVGPLDL